MGLWFVDSFDLQDQRHVGRKYKNPDNPHPAREFQTGKFDSVLKRTGHQSFRGTLQKWHGDLQGRVRQGIAFHSTTVETGTWIRQFGSGDLFYELSYDGTQLTARGFHGIIQQADITILEGWNYLEWAAELHSFAQPFDPYIHEVRLNGETVLGPGQVVGSVLGPPQYTTINSTLGNKDDYYLLQFLGVPSIHTEFLGAIRVVALKPIENGVLNTFSRFPRRLLVQSVFSVTKNYQAVDDNFDDFSAVPDDDLTHLFDKPEGEEESYKMQQINPSLLGIFGFQWNPYGVVGTTSFSGAETLPPRYRHIYYNPDEVKRNGSIFGLPRGPFTTPSPAYAYRTEFREWDLTTIESGHPNTGGYVNNSRFGFEIETGATPIGRFSQAYIEVVLPEIEPPPPPPEQAAVATVLSFRFAKLWDILLLDGTRFRFTNHNMDLVNPQDGLTYTPIASLRMTALQRRTGLDPTNAEVQGIVDVVTYNSLLAGKMRGAVITEFILDWQYPWSGSLLSTTNRIREMSFDGIKWTAELSSIDRILLLPKGHVYGRTCRHVLGDEGCKVNLDLLKQSLISAIPPIVGRTRFRASVSATLDAFGNDRARDGYHAFGNVQWTSGNNVGIFSEVRLSTVVDVNDPTLQDFVLQIPLPFDILLGDRLTIWPGCDKVLATCRDKFQNEIDGDSELGNLKNYGGFPTIPGKDGVFAPLSEAKHVISFGDFFDNPIAGLIGDILF